MADGDAYMTVAVWQGNIKRGKISQKLEQVATIAGRAATYQADVLIFPEAFLTEGQGRAGIRAAARALDEDVDAELARIARSNGVALLIGAHEEAAESIYNTANFYCPHWGRIGSYRKRALSENWEKANLARGQQPLALDYRGWKLGVLIGSDVAFPELVREVAHEGIDAVLITASGEVDQRKMTDLLLPVRAMENQIFLAYANRTGPQSGKQYAGASRIIAPDGKMLAQSPDEGPDMLVATLAKSEIAGARAEFCYLDEAQRMQAQPEN